tara:strand:+ start:73 stop:498 length:426 start_codon:yes stop_codon:yes gene_type:complete
MTNDEQQPRAYQAWETARNHLVDQWNSEGEQPPPVVGCVVGLLVTILCWAAFSNMPIDQPGALAVIAGLVAGVGAGYGVHRIEEEQERKRDPELFAIKQTKKQAEKARIQKANAPFNKEQEKLLRSGLWYHLFGLNPKDKD